MYRDNPITHFLLYLYAAMKKLTHHPFFIRLLHWEYWPFHAVYAVLYGYWLWLCLRARSFFFFSLSNPTVKNGGFLMESKKEIYDLIPVQYYPDTLFFRAGTSLQNIREQLEIKGFQFPLIAKPDVGLRGIAVKKLHAYRELEDYVTGSRVDFLIQEYVPYEKEAGIFYYRLPGEEKGTISGIVEKEFLAVTGDGISTTCQLLHKDKRHILQLPALKKLYGPQLERILPAGEKQVLVPYGNHCRGAKFLDAGYRADADLTVAIDAVCRQIDGFYFGRLDIRFTSWEDLKQGKNFSIIELNGAGSEPTHIYDPGHSIFFAWKEIIRHWNILYKISRTNRRITGTPYMDFHSGMRMFRENFQYLKLVKE